MTDKQFETLLDAIQTLGMRVENAIPSSELIGELSDELRAIRGDVKEMRELLQEIASPQS